MEIEGTITQELGIREGKSEHGPWRIASYLLTTNGYRPHHVVFDVSDGTDRRIDRLDLHAGHRVRLWIDIDARQAPATGRWYNTIRAYDARPAGTPTTAPATAQPAAPAPAPSTPPQAPAAQDGFPF